MGPDKGNLFMTESKKQPILPYRYKARAGRHVRGQRPYEPFLDAENWCKEAIDIKLGGLSPLAIERANNHMHNRP